MILMYHKVYLESPTMWWVDVDNFYRQMCEIKHKKVVYLDDYDPSNPEHVVITFDGCYSNVLQYAVPLLKKFSYPFEVFITSDYLGKDNSFDMCEPLADFVTFEELKVLMDNGARIQWHSKTHMNLENVYDLDAIARELEVPSNLKSLGNNCFKWFAYPHGTWNDAVMNETKKRFVGALSCDQGNNSDLHKLNRITVTNESSFKAATICVIIASYNYGSFLVEAVESVLRQTRPADEILIVDDCSKDNTAEIGKAYQNEYPKLIKFHRNERNLGIVNNFNNAVKLTKSGYICFLGADNRFVSNYLEKTAELLDSDNDLAVAYTDYALFGQRAKLVYDSYRAEKRGEIIENYYYIINFPEFDLTELRKENFIHGSSMYRRKAFDEVGGYKEEKDVPEDYNLFLRMVLAGWKAKRVSLPILEYRQHSREQANIAINSYAELNFYKSHYHKLSNEIQFMNVREKGMFQVYLPDSNGYLESKSVIRFFDIDNEAISLEIEIEPDMSGTLRVDPLAEQAYIEIDTIKIYEHGTAKIKENEIFCSNKENDFYGLRAGGNIIMLDKRESFNFVCLNKDPQLFLDFLSEDYEGSKLLIEIVMRVILIRSDGFMQAMEDGIDGNVRKLYDITERLNRLEKMYIERNAEADHFRNEVIAFTDQMYIKEKEFEEKNVEIVNLRNRVGMLTDQVCIMEKEIENKDRDIKYKEKEIENKDRDIKYKEKEIENKDIEIKNLLDEIIELKNDIANKLNQLAEREEEIFKCKTLELDYRDTINELNTRLDSIYNSRGFRFLLKYYKLRDTVLRK